MENGKWKVENRIWKMEKGDKIVRGVLANRTGFGAKIVPATDPN
jgi:hypothetical protein